MIMVGETLKIEFLGYVCPKSTDTITYQIMKQPPKQRTHSDSNQDLGQQNSHLRRLEGQARNGDIIKPLSTQKMS